VKTDERDFAPPTSIPFAQLETDKFMTPPHKTAAPRLAAVLAVSVARADNSDIAQFYDRMKCGLDAGQMPGIFYHSDT